MQPVSYDPTADILDAAWFLLNSRGGVYFVLVDQADLAFVLSWSPWHRRLSRTSVDPDNSGRIWSAGRCARHDGKQTSVLLHRVLVAAQDIATGENLAPGLIADHVNGRRWDNRRANLRLVNHAESNDNQGARRGKVFSDRGITSKMDDKSGAEYWLVQLQKDGRRYYAKAFRKDRHTLDEVRAIRDAAYQAEWGRPPIRR